MLPPRQLLLNIEPSKRILLRKEMTNDFITQEARYDGDGYLFQFKENLGKNNKNKQPTLILEKDRNEYNIVLNNDDTITISKNNRKENDQQKLIDEIQSTFFKEDKTIKTLFENLEYELTDEQMKFYNKIKELLAYKKISAEQPKAKYSLCGKENNWIGTKTDGRFGCCGW